MTDAHILLVILLYAGVLVLFIECWIVFRNLKTPLHGYLLFSCVAGLVNELGYTLEIQCQSLEAYTVALRFSYFGRIWLCFSLFMFTAEFCHVKVPTIFKRVITIIHLVIYGTILTMNFNDLYYKNVGFSLDNGFPIFYRENGPAHHLLMQLHIFYIICVFIWLFTSLRKQKSRISILRHLILLAAFFIQSGCFLVQISGILPISKIFDLTMIGNVVQVMFMFVAIFTGNLLGIIDIARDFMIDRLSEGVIAVDNEGKVQYFNEPALSLFPELKTAPQDAVKGIVNALKNEDTITINNRIYTPEENELGDRGETLGKIYSMMDATELKQNEYKLKAEAEMLEMAAQGMRDRLLSTEELMRQDRALRHDRRHFEALLFSLLQDGKADEARECLKERLAQEPHSSIKYCDNATVNAALTHYVYAAERKMIKVNVKTNIPVNTEIDEMKLAIAISNLLENAIHACEKVPESERFIDITAKHKQQLLLEVVNSCDKKVDLDEDGYPFTTEEGHGIGTRSVLAFVKETDSAIRYIAEDKTFKVQMIIG